MTRWNELPDSLAGRTESPRLKSNQQDKVKIPPRIKDKAMNGLEQEWADILETMKRSKYIIDWKYEPFNLRLANNTYYRPDFMVIYPGHIEIHEIKGGFIRDDSVKAFKVAAEQFPWFVFKMIQKRNKNSEFITIREV